MYCDIQMTPKMFTFFDKPELFRSHFRISLPAFGVLLQLTENHKLQGWSDEVEWCVLLAWLATGASYRMVGLASGIPRQSVCDIVHRKINVLLSLCKHVIKVPTGAEVNLIGEKFAEKARSSVFLCTAGAIDGTHINCHVQADQKVPHINRKKQTSIQLQAVCDADKTFLNVFVGYPGSVHDARVLRNSDLFKDSLYPPQGHFLLGDSGYPCLVNPISLITPFRGPEAAGDSLKKNFNTALSKARVCIEIAFGLLKVRWRSIFDKDLSVKTHNVSKVAMCCCILHNVCVTNPGDWSNFDVSTSTESNLHSRSRVDYDDEAAGVERRNELFAQFLTQRTRSNFTPVPSTDHSYFLTFSLLNCHHFTF